MNFTPTVILPEGGTIHRLEVRNEVSHNGVAVWVKPGGGTAVISDSALATSGFSSPAAFIYSTKDLPQTSETGRVLIGNGTQISTTRGEIPWDQMEIGIRYSHERGSDGVRTYLTDDAKLGEVRIGGAVPVDARLTASPSTERVKISATGSYSAGVRTILGGAYNELGKLTVSGSDIESDAEGIVTVTPGTLNGVSIRDSSITTRGWIAVDTEVYGPMDDFTISDSSITAQRHAVSMLVQGSGRLGGMTVTGAAGFTGGDTGVYWQCGLHGGTCTGPLTVDGWTTTSNEARWRSPTDMEPAGAWTAPSP